MAEHIELGKRGENLACALLEKKGLKILARNLQLRKLECDIIATNDEFVVFVEVKTRTNISFGTPDVFVTRDKQRNLIRLADGYMRIHNIQKEVRFDIFSVVIRGEYEEAVHLEDAWTVARYG